ncbi:energy transducer TonB [Variovorax arabinosiphilus]|uniref:energy transducer TonB n=1 Tax=Variovorax arabinosiphilus TaxID=3053498 RepID=UPI0025785A59|nr:MULTISPECIES: TonB family protein [unclassified Variovorax]MDM0119950.1 TonB family protein [Variovorax sp. J2L1-78]MDM0128138.1 TonB family protein [Variovorax sp. J2L1-63]MDM0231838.1 TonB family protein [Variovorax sp. J2R1-6]
MKTQHIKGFAIAALLCCMLGMEGCATGGGGESDAWPAKVVSANQLRPAEPLQLKMPRRNMNDPMPSGTAVLRLHVDERGIVRKTLLVSSSGDAVLDSAAARALVGAKFVPYREAGEAVAVTTLMPMGVKASAQCRGLSPLDC